MSIHIDDQLRQALWRHAESGYPQEVCGLILGHWHQDDAMAHSYHPCDNDSRERRERRFLIDPEQYQRLEDQADRNGCSVVSIVHSHPDHPDRPSEFDRLHAWPGLSYIILSVAGGKVVSYACWRLRDDRSGFDSESIVVESVPPG